MTYEEYNAFCGGLPATTYVVQWGGSSDGELKDYLRQSHLIVSRGLPKKTRIALGLLRA
jgi:predicted DNA-binding protein (MmcQ/YjbR family)